MLGIVGGGARIVVHEVALERAVDQNRQFARRGGDRFGLANPRRQSSIERAQGGLPPTKGHRRHPEEACRSIGGRLGLRTRLRSCSSGRASSTRWRRWTWRRWWWWSRRRARCGRGAGIPTSSRRSGLTCRAGPPNSTSRRPRFALQTGRQGAAQSHAPIDTHVLDALATAGFIRSYTDSTPHARRRIRPPRPMAASSRALQTP